MTKYIARTIALLLLSCAVVLGGSGGNDVPVSFSYPTLGGSNDRQGNTSLFMPIHAAAPMQHGWEYVLSGHCAGSMLADVRGWVYVLCEEVVESESDMNVTLLAPTLYAFNASLHKVTPLWSVILDPVKSINLEEATTGSLALTTDQLWIVASTRVGVYAVSTILGKMVWEYKFDLPLPAAAVGVGLAIGTPSLLQPQPNVFVTLNTGLACLRGGQVIWQFQATETGKPNEQIDVSAPTLDEEKNVVIFSWFRSSNGTVTIAAIDSNLGWLKWTHSFPIEPQYLENGRLRQAVPFAVLVNHTAYLSVSGYELLQVDSVSGFFFDTAPAYDDRPFYVSTKVQVGVPPVLSYFGDTASLISVCMEALADEDGSSVSYELCANDLLGIPLNISGVYPLSCPSIESGGGGSNDVRATRAPISQPLIGSNQVILVPLSGSIDGGDGPCFNVIPDITSGLERWDHVFLPGMELIQTPIMISSKQMLGLNYNGTHTTLWSLKARSVDDSAPRTPTPIAKPIVTPTPRPMPVPAPVAPKPVYGRRKGPIQDQPGIKIAFE